MTPQTHLRTALAIAAATLLLLLVACAHSVNEDDTKDNSLFAPDAKSPASLTVCIETACPSPWATCPDVAGLCNVDTGNDVEHCGGCGACLTPSKAQHETAVCTKGHCAYACGELYADCNHLPADGCEVYLGDDPKNCGGCGIACDPGVICWTGACGCPSGFTQCGIECKDLSSDNTNCGACGQLCEAPKSSSDPAWICGANDQPPNTAWSCTSAECKLECKPDWGDCDKDFCGNGCEVDETKDPNNCGGCGNKCDPGQDCVDATCICPAGTVRCGDTCTDLNVDPYNCGLCDNECPGPGGAFPGKTQNGTPTCSNGICGYTCFAGFADCDKKIFNGCEVAIGSDPLHCGGCTTKCDTASGQPCVEGQCLTKPCDPPPVIY